MVQNQTEQGNQLAREQANVNGGFGSRVNDVMNNQAANPNIEKLQNLKLEMLKAAP